MANNEKDQKSYWDQFVKQFKAALTGQTYVQVEALKNSYPALFDKINSWFDKDVFPQEEEAWNYLLKFFKDRGLLTPELEEVLLNQKDLPGLVSLLLFVVVSWSLINSYQQSISRITVLPEQRKLLQENRPEIAPIEQSVRAAFVAPEKYPEIYDTLSKHGLSDQAIDLLFLSQYNLLDINTLRTLFLRSEISDDQLFTALREHGFTDSRIKDMVKTWQVIPGAQDILYMVGKEAFEPDTIKEFGLDQELPSGQLEWLRKQGLSDYWAQKYWIAHWTQPSIQMGFEMLHRRVIDNAQLDKLFRAQEIPPFWREKLTEISHSPYTRVDVRRMHDLGVLSLEEVFMSYLDIGYDEDKALNMTKFTMAYNSDRDRDLTRSQIEAGYKDKILTRQEADDLLQQLGYTEDGAEFILTSADYEEEKEIEDLKLKNLEDKFENNLISEFDVISGLGQLGLPSERTSALLEKWKLQKLDNAKMPSKTDLKNFYLSGVIKEDKLREEFRKLGYNNEYTEMYISYYKLKKEGEANEST